MGRTKKTGREEVLQSLVREYHRVGVFDPRVFIDPRWTQESPKYHPVPGNHPDPPPSRPTARVLPWIIQIEAVTRKVAPPPSRR
ncbi:hypothetical protein ALC53_06666 [Atta colombica]|uniref:Uncharacterized protein n=1 Tax=Atta colombica TaxID=520822 RepID=A0A195BFG9_9HYME|nr:hypothetical protein ALC53_06666 [Atta colombica]